MEPDRLSHQNLTTYRRPDVVALYAAARGLKPGERTLIERHADEFHAARLLDLGFGGGRTTAALAGSVREYVGLEYSADQVAKARAAHPGVDLRHGDARDLSQFADGTFDIVLFSFNGIDYVSHEDRLTVLAEVRRVLRAGGLFMFTSHDRGHRRYGLLPWQRRRPGRTMLRESLAALRARGTRRALAPLTMETDDYAIVNDDAHDYSLLTYYIAPATQMRQLVQAGFSDARCCDVNGQPGVGSRDAVFLYYTARA